MVKRFLPLLAIAVLALSIAPVAVFTASAQAVAQCADNVDNDGDGHIDADDMGCDDPYDNSEVNAGTQSGTYQCSDSIDNDGDGKIDAQDPGCSAANDTDEYNAVTTTSTTGSTDIAITKSGPGTVQRGQTIVYTLSVRHVSGQPATNVIVQDPIPYGTTFNSAQSSPSCRLYGDMVECVANTLNAGEQRTFQIGFATSSTAQCNSVITNTAALCNADQGDTNENNDIAPDVHTVVLCTPTAQCNDGIDNDNDGKIDAYDPGCTGPTDTNEGDEFVPQCRDNRDNDGDGRIDGMDPGCSAPDDNDEYNQNQNQCNDGIDNDGDGRIDAADLGCDGPDDTNEGDDIQTQCRDGRDNDGDGKIDAQDPGCSHQDDNNEGDDFTPQCRDNRDNDMDGKTDAQDPDCSNQNDNSEYGAYISGYSNSNTNDQYAWQDNYNHVNAPVNGDNNNVNISTVQTNNNLQYQYIQAQQELNAINALPQTGIRDFTAPLENAGRFLSPVSSSSGSFASIMWSTMTVVGGAAVAVARKKFFI